MCTARILAWSTNRRAYFRAISSLPFSLSTPTFNLFSAGCRLYWKNVNHTSHRAQLLLTRKMANLSPGPKPKRQRTLGIVQREVENGAKIRVVPEVTSYEHNIIIADSKEAAEALAKERGLLGVRVDFKGVHLVAAKKSVSVIVVPNDTSRHNSTARPDFVVKALQADPLLNSSAAIGVIIAKTNTVKDAIWALSVYRAFPSCNLKTSEIKDQMITFTTGVPKSVQIVGESIRIAQVLVDLPPSHLTAQTFEDFVREALQSYLTVQIDKIEGKELEKRGFGGLWGVGKGAQFNEGRAPRLLIMKYAGSGDSTKPFKTLVGKGIIYDTGGLAIKPRDGMCGMKRDMGGSAGVFAGFLATVRAEVKENICCLLCIAENSVSATAFRNDDILHMYSGKTVEVNNTDAEGRLVLGDGVAYASKDLKSDLILTMATLTGAQGIATGQLHAGMVSDSEVWEEKVLAAAQKSGELVWPLPYCPELHMEEFKSSCADMKNSVANRANAQVSCAASFIRAHIEEKWSGAWVHIDMASPAYKGERATGYGTALVAAMLGVW
ncbi:unnamed protein product [Amoebophrya sp. A120]|nr:unnamed protein product [Amoebophrya sp. A120]|eukprot:GSA120T00017730001.1